MNLTTDEERKFVPLTVIVKPGSPTVLEVGEILEVVGIGLLTVNVCAFDVPPPGVGLKTVMLNVPGLVRSLVGIVTLSSVESTNVVVRSEPLNLATEDGIKFVPLTVMVKPESPTNLEVGEMLVVVGTGFKAVTVNVCAFDVPPPGAGLKTVILNVPALVRSLVGIVTLSSVESTNVVVRSEPLNLATEDGIKFVPLTVIVKPELP